MHYRFCLKSKSILFLVRKKVAAELRVIQVHEAELNIAKVFLICVKVTWPF